MKNYKVLLSLFLVNIFISCKNTTPNLSTESFSKNLITVDAVKSLMDKKASVIIFEISKSAKYEQGHLANAFNIWRPDYENNEDYDYTGMRATKVQLEQLLSVYGVMPSSKIILYDTKGGSDALRVWWLLTHYGHLDVVIMDGGKKAWEKANYPLVKEVPSRVPTAQYLFGTNQTSPKMISLNDVQAALQDRNTIILDTREPEEYKGQPYISKGKLYKHKKGAFTHGCIPGAVHLNWSDAVKLSDDHRLKSIKDLKYNFERAGITPDKKIIAYCQSGVRSAHTAFVLKEILGYPNVYNYDGSWIEWSYHYENGAQVAIEQHTSPEEVNRIYEDLGKTLNRKEQLIQ